MISQILYFLKSHNFLVTLRCQIIITMSIADQFNLIVSILSSLLTGCMLLLFVENLHLSNKVFTEYNDILKPFYSKLNNYLKFVGVFYHSSNLHTLRNEKNSRILNLIHKISEDGTAMIITSKGYYTIDINPQELRKLCAQIKAINEYLCDDEYEEIQTLYQKITFDTESYVHMQQYLQQCAPIYANYPINLALLSEVSNNFYDETYLPILFVLPYYYAWQKHDKIFKWIIFITIFINLISIMLALFCWCCIPNLLFNVFCLILCLMFFGLLCYFTSIDRLARKAKIEGDSM